MLKSHSVRLLASAALAGVLALSVAGCKTTRSSETTGSIAAPRSDGQWRSESQAWGERYRSNPRDVDAAIRYARSLRALDQRSQAAAVLEQAVIHNPKNTALLGAYGRALADVGNNQQAMEVLSRAHTPDQPDWRILSVQGAVLDQMGRHDDARRYYSAALKIVPGEPSVLSNLGLSYALSKNLPQAETTLRRAAAGGNRADPRVRQNLALVVGLQGRFEEAEGLARADLPSEEAAANVAYLRQMIAQQADPKKTVRADARRPR
jgi:Flp pilus assembly protein TadD